MFLFHHKYRINTESDWAPTDDLARYKPFNYDDVINYSKSEIKYKFNSEGFRCDEFSIPSDFPILFLGCSFTEGIGLPLNEVWTNHILNKIKHKKNANNIPLWSLAVGGTGIDFATTILYEYIKTIKPQIILYLMSGMMRRLFCYENNFLKTWIPGVKEVNRDVPECLKKIFVDENYALYQAYKNLIILNLLCENYNTKLIIYDIHDMDSIPITEKETLFKYFPKITYIKLPKFSPHDYNIISNRPYYARDNLHWGAWWHIKLSNFIWETIKNKI